MKIYSIDEIHKEIKLNKHYELNVPVLKSAFEKLGVYVWEGGTVFVKIGSLNHELKNLHDMYYNKNHIMIYEKINKKHDKYSYYKILSFNECDFLTIKKAFKYKELILFT